MDFMVIQRDLANKNRDLNGNYILAMTNSLPRKIAHIWMI